MLRITIMNRAFCCAVIFIVFFVQGYACRAADARWDSDSVSAGRVGEDPNAWVQECSPCESNQAEVQISALSSAFLVRSDKRRIGNEWVSTFNLRLSPDD